MCRLNRGQLVAGTASLLETFLFIKRVPHFSFSTLGTLSRDGGGFPGSSREISIGRPGSLGMMPRLALAWQVIRETAFSLATLAFARGSPIGIVGIPGDRTTGWITSTRWVLGGRPAVGISRVVRVTG